MQNDILIDRNLIGQSVYFFSCGTNFITTPGITTSTKRERKLVHPLRVLVSSDWGRIILQTDRKQLQAHAMVMAMAVAMAMAMPICSLVKNNSRFGGYHCIYYLLIDSSNTTTLLCSAVAALSLSCLSAPPPQYVYICPLERYVFIFNICLRDSGYVP